MLITVVNQRGEDALDHVDYSYEAQDDLVLVPGDSIDPLELLILIESAEARYEP